MAAPPGSLRPAGPRPRALWVLLICYALSYLLETASWMIAMPRSAIELSGVIVTGLYSLGVGICLWRGVDWVRMWVVFTTVLALLMLFLMAKNNMWGAIPGMAVASLMRIAVGLMLFLPSIRRWFAPRRA